MITGIWIAITKVGIVKQPMIKYRYFVNKELRVKSLFIMILLLASSSILASSNQCEFALFEREYLD